MEERDRTFFEYVPWNMPDQNALGRNIVKLIEDALVHLYECTRAGTRGYAMEVQVSLRDELHMLHLEEGTTERCCG